MSCTVERYGSVVHDCSVAKQSLVALSTRKAEFYGIVRAVATSKANLTDLGADRNEGGGDKCIRQQCSTRNLHENRLGKGADTFQSKSCGNRKRIAKKGVPVGVGGHVVELG